MSENQLTDVLTATADRIPVNPIPLSSIASGARRARRKQYLSGATLGALVVVAAVVGTLVVDHDRSAPPSPAQAPQGTRLVGITRAAIAVPDSWGTGLVRCGTPTADTVRFDGGVTETCAAVYGAGIDSVTLSTDARSTFGPFRADEALSIDGVPAERQATICRTVISGEQTTICQATLRIPSLHTYFVAESTTDAAMVDTILGWVQVLPDLVGIPDSAGYFLDDQARSGATFVEALEQRGLTVTVIREPVDGLDPGFVAAVSPAPGTMVKPGSTVTVTIAR